MNGIEDFRSKQVMVRPKYAGSPNRPGMPRRLFSLALSSSSESGEGSTRSILIKPPILVGS